MFSLDDTSAILVPENNEMADMLVSQSCESFVCEQEYFFCSKKDFIFMGDGHASENTPFLNN